MKISVFLLTLVTALTVNAQSKNALCGTVYEESFIGNNSVILYIHDSSKEEYVEKTVKAATPSARDFLSIISVHGGAICDTDLIHDAPFEICFTGDLKTGRAQAIYCGKVRKCKGTGCGGNGFSVNSGSR